MVAGEGIRDPVKNLYTATMRFELAPGGVASDRVDCNRQSLWLVSSRQSGSLQLMGDATDVEVTAFLAADVPVIRGTRGLGAAMSMPLLGLVMAYRCGEAPDAHLCAGCTLELAVKNIAATPRAFQLTFIFQAER